MLWRAQRAFREKDIVFLLFGMKAAAFSVESGAACPNRQRVSLRKTVQV